MRRFQTPLVGKIGNQHLYKNMPIETAFSHQRARSALSKSVLKLRHNTLILLSNSAEMGTTCCLQPWGKWAWNCSSPDKILNIFSSAIIKLPTRTIDVTPSFRHYQQGQGSSGTFTSPGLYQAWICRQGCSRVERALPFLRNLKVPWSSQTF